MSKQSWRGSTLLNPEPPVLVSCGGLDKPNLITIGWTGTICTQPSMVSISVRPERSSQRVVRSTESCIYFLVAGCGGHSSNAIAIVDAILD